MSTLLSRRAALLGGLASLALPAFAKAQGLDDLFLDAPDFGPDEGPLDPAADPSQLPPPESPTDYPIRPANLSKLPDQFHRQAVAYDGGEWPGTIIVDPNSRHLYLVLTNGEALRYGVGVGRSGFAWSGVAKVGLKRRWPRWLPPAEMVARDEMAAEWANGMPGGPDNPLGARALYLYQDGADTLYRIHGTNDPSSIGKAKSSGCVRLLNQDIADLYRRVPIGSRVVVLPGDGA